jgi:Fic family protein
LFDYASPEETPALMFDLVRWYNAEEKKSELSPVELAALFHYRYIRIHPFEDGNGRIARLLVNYIFLRHDYPMIVVRTDDRNNHLKVLHQCDLSIGKNPFDGAGATIEQIMPLVAYIENIVQKRIADNIDFVKREISGTINYYWWYNDELITIKNDNQQRITELLGLNPNVSVRSISDKLGINKSAVQKHIAALKEKGFIIREGGTKGKWIVHLKEVKT